MAATFASSANLDWSSVISAPHLAAVALPVMAFISHSRSSSVSSTSSLTPSNALSAVPRASLWQGDSLDEFVVDSPPVTASSTPNPVSLTGLVSKAVQSWRSRIAAQAEMLSEITDLQAEDDGDEADWYAHERSTPTITRSLSPGPSRGRSSRRPASRARSRSRSCNSNTRVTLSAKELRQRLVALETAPMDKFLLAPPPDRRRAGH